MPVAQLRSGGAAQLGHAKPWPCGRRGASGSYPALHELAERLAGHQHLDELHELVAGHWELLAGWQARQHDMRVVCLAAELGDDEARRWLELGLARLHERAAAGDEHARQFFAENPDWRQYPPPASPRPRVRAQRIAEIAT